MYCFSCFYNNKDAHGWWSADHSGDQHLEWSMKMESEKFVIVRDIHSSKELARGFQPARAYTYEAAIERAKECANNYPGVSFLVCEIKGKAGIQQVIYQKL